MTTTRQPRRTPLELDFPTNVVSQLELVDLFHRKSVHELVIVEVAPAIFHLQAIILWRVGRWTLKGARHPRNFRSLDTLVRHLKTMGVGRTVMRLELLP